MQADAGTDVRVGRLNPNWSTVRRSVCVVVVASLVLVGSAVVATGAGAVVEGCLPTQNGEYVSENQWSDPDGARAVENEATLWDQVWAARWSDLGISKRCYFEQTLDDASRGYRRVRFLSDDAAEANAEENRAWWHLDWAPYYEFMRKRSADWCNIGGCWRLGLS